REEGAPRVVPAQTMLLHPSRSRRPAPARRGAALMLSVLVLLVLVAVVFQINIATSTDSRVARNDISLTKMDLAAESVLLLKFDQLVQDAEAAAAEGGAGGGAGALGGLGGGGAAGGFPAGGDAGAEGGAGAAGPVDSREDEWARVESTDSINDLRLRILVQDENSKYNVLSMLDADEERADKAFRRVTRIIDLFREGTEVDVDTGEAERMAELILDHLRAETERDRPRLVTDDPEAAFDSKPMLSLRELVAYPEFEPILFRDFRTEDGTVVHSLSSYLTCWSSLQTRTEMEEARAAAPGSGQAGGAAGGSQEDGGDPAAGGDGTGNDGNAGAGGGGQGSQAFAGTQSNAGSAAGAQGSGGGTVSADGGAVMGRVNVNTAPPVVLKALMEEADIDPRFWDDAVEYRNEEDEDQIDPDAEPVFDQFGEEIVPRQVFGSADALSEVSDWDLIEPVAQQELLGLVTVQSDVFTIFVTVQRDTSLEQDQGLVEQMTREEYEEQLYSPSNLTRTVACTVWRRQGEEGVELVPLQRWEYLDYIPYEILDYPEEDR
ncbi:MAG: hypothetical protein AAFZ65_10820, partial [Planctomycetota bacterium]